MRSCHRALYILLALSLVVLARGWAQEGAETGRSVPADEPPSSTTEVAGDLPVDLRGVWLIVGNGKLPKGNFRNALELETIQQRDGKLEVHLLLRKLPQTLQDDLDQANRQLREWSPSPDQIAELARSLDRLEPLDPMRYQRHTVRLVARSQYEAVLRPALVALVRESMFAMEVEHVYRPHPIDAQSREAQLMSDKAIYGVQRVEPTFLEGEHTRTILAAAIVPVPITTSGRFVMHRLRGPEEMPAVPGRSLRERLSGFLGGLLRGCK
jgi:hypothetical protein